MLDSRAYDAYGRELAVRTPMGVATMATDPFGFDAKWGYYLDRELGTYLCQNRTYDPSTARWLERDPIGLAGGINPYSYCAANPVWRVDQSRLSFWSWGDDQWTGFSRWFNGRDDEDDNGHPVHIGGLPGLLNTCDNGMTYGGTVHLRDEQSFQNYMRSPHWQNHEEGHLKQHFEIPDFVPYAACAVVGYFHEKLTVDGRPSRGRWTGHDYNYYEEDAEERARAKDGIWEFGSHPEIYRAR